MTDHRPAPNRRLDGVVDEVIDDVKRSIWPVLLVLAALVLVNLLTNLLAPGLYLVWAWTGVALLVVIGRRDRESWTELGLGKIPRRALWASLIIVLTVALVYLVGAIMPGTREAFGDDRVSDLSAAEVAWRALVRVPLGTVLLEEVAFRGVLLAMLWRRMGTWPGILISSAVFGLWHVLPSSALTSTNEALGDAVGTSNDARLLGVLLAVVTTFVAGVVFCELRRRFGHLLVPMAFHWATNGFGYLFAWVIVTRDLV